MNPKYKHGGARPGSGRRPLAGVVATERLVQVKLTPIEKARVEALAAHLGLTKSDTVRLALLELAKAQKLPEPKK